VEACADCQQALERLTERAAGGVTQAPAATLEPPDASCADFVRRLEDRSLTLLWTRSLAGQPPSSETPPPPTVPGFEILAELGRGGMGVVYKALQVGLDRVVALKMILHASPEARARFHTEARAVASLRHPHIVQVYHYDEANGRPYFCLEYVEGGSLEARVRHTPQPPGQAALLTEQVARAMQHAHERGVIHRDLKPANVLLQEEDLTPRRKAAKEAKGEAGGGQGPAHPSSASPSLAPLRLGVRSSSFTPKITDFGLAKLVESSPADQGQTRLGAVMGTPPYMSPEQARGRDIGPAADIWALGALLYDLLTGRPPFHGETAHDTLQQVLTQEPVPPRRLQPKVPRDLQTICLKCLEKDPGNRYASAGEVADDLQHFREGRPIKARPVGRLERALRWAKRDPATAALVALAVASVLLLAGVLHWRSRVAADRRTQLLLQQRERAEAAYAKLDEVRELWAGARAAPPDDLAVWEAALKAAQRAELVAKRAEGDEEVQEQATDARAELERQVLGRRLAWRLANLRLQRADPGDRDPLQADRDYTLAFADFGVPPDRLAPDEAARRVRTSPVAPELVAALDDWTARRRAVQRGMRERPHSPDPRQGKGRGPSDWRRLLEVARKADPDPKRDRIRAALSPRDLPALRALVGGVERSEGDLASLPPATLLLLGDRLLLLEDPATAVRVLRPAQQRYENDFWINHTLASAYLRLSPPDADEAVRFFNAAVALRRRIVLAHSNLAAALNEKARQNLAAALNEKARQAGPARRRLLAEAEAEARKAVALAESSGRHPGYAQAYNNLGLALRGQGRLEEAVAAYRKAVALAPGYALAHNNLGVALERQGHRDQALACYRTAIRLDPAYAQAHDNLGLALRARGEPEQAALAHRAALAHDPRSAEAHNNLGSCLSQLGRLDEAIACYRKAVRLRPGSAQLHNNLGVALDRQGRLDEAVLAYRRALRIEPSAARTYTNLGRCLWALGKADQALAAYRLAVRLQPGSAVALNTLGSALLACSRPHEAAAAYRHALCLRHDYAWALCNLGHVLRRRGRLAESLACLERGHALGSAQPGWSLPSGRWAEEAWLLVELEPCLPALLALGAAKRRDGGVRVRLAGVVADLPEPTRSPDLDSPQVRALLARLCASHGFHETATRLFQEAFADQPALASPVTGHRLRAARSAALAGCGRSADAAGRDERARAALRAQALAWLRADLALWATRVRSAPPPVRRALLLALRERQYEPDLACLRDEAALAWLPEAERRAWQELWADIAALAEQALR
jgi:serine/threonine-protein kinase